MDHRLAVPADGQLPRIPAAFLYLLGPWALDLASLAELRRSWELIHACPGVHTVASPRTAWPVPCAIPYVSQNSRTRRSWSAPSACVAAVPTVCCGHVAGRGQRGESVGGAGDIPSTRPRLRGVEGDQPSVTEDAVVPSDIAMTGYFCRETLVPQMSRQGQLPLLGRPAATARPVHRVHAQGRRQDNRSQTDPSAGRAVPSLDRQSAHPRRDHRQLDDLSRQAARLLASPPP